MHSISLYPRLHITLLQMSDLEYRVNGGVGFAIADPELKILSFMSMSDSFKVIDNRKHGLSESGKKRLLKKLIEIKQKFNLKKTVGLKIIGNASAHSGFGTGTNIRLGCIELLFKANNFTNYSQKQLQYISGRGGTSGIGINTYFHGGFIYDIGHNKNIITESFTPSNKSENRKNLPLKLKQLNMPDWEVGLYMPTSISRISDQAESDFFNDLCPIERKSVIQTVYHVTFGLVPAVMESNFQTFCESIKRIQECKWKKSEKQLYGNTIFDIEEKLYRFGASAVGMSSLGPCVYFFSDNLQLVIDSIQQSNLSGEIYRSIPVNYGRSIKDA